MTKTVFFSLLLGASAAAAADVTGTWAVKGDVSGYPIDITCALTQKDADLTGICKGGNRPDRTVTGHVKEMTVEFGYDLDYDGNKMHATYSGKLDSDSAMKGTVDVNGNSGEFSATKQK